ncbi:MAG: hypothetical protein ACMXYE_05640 [Candidatus Woesearchaeota archaeon]
MALKKNTNPKGYWNIYKRVIWSFAVSFLAFIPILNLILILPFAGYLSWSAISLSRSLPKKDPRWKRNLALIVSGWSLFNVIFIWIFAFVMLWLVSFGVIVLD